MNLPASAVAKGVSNLQYKHEGRPLVQGVNVYPLTVLYYSANNFLGLCVFLCLCHPIHRRLVYPETRTPRGMLLDGSAPNREQARIWVTSEFLFCKRLVQSVEHFCELLDVRRQNRVLGSNCSPHAETREEASRA